MQVCKLCEQQGIKLTTKQTSTDARIAPLEAGVILNSRRVMSRRRSERLLKYQYGDKQRESCSDFPGMGAKHKEPC